MSALALAQEKEQAASPLDLPPEQFKAGLNRRKENREALFVWLREALVKGVDFGQVQTRRGLSKPSLWKPGAEKICGMLGVTIHFPALEDYEKAAVSGVDIDSIVLRCEIRDQIGRCVASGIGGRSVKQEKGDLNKALKMAAKSAHVDAVLRFAGLSEVFTQDIEDMKEMAAEAEETGRSETSNYIRISPQKINLLKQQAARLSLPWARCEEWIRRAGNVERIEDLPAVHYSLICVKMLNIMRREGVKDSRREEEATPPSQLRVRAMAYLARTGGAPGVAAKEARDSAKRTRDAAQYAERSQDAREELEDAARLEQLASELEMMAQEEAA